MRRLSWLRSGLARLFRRRQRDAELQEEIALHLEARTADLVRRGISAKDAGRIARAEFGSVQSCVEQTRHAWGFRAFADLRQDLRHAIRMCSASPGLTVTAVLSIAIGIGANASIFSVADALAFRPLGLPDPKAVVSVSVQTPEETRGTGGLSYPNYLDFRARGRAFEGVVADQLVTFGFAATREALPDMRLGMAVSDNFFSVLHIVPAVGRPWASNEGVTDGANPVVVLGHDFWAGVLGGDRSVVGRDVWLNGMAMKVIGIAPERFTGMDQYIRPAFFITA
jgi:hypothetical protein